MQGVQEMKKLSHLVVAMEDGGPKGHYYIYIFIYSYASIHILYSLDFFLAQFAL